MTLTVEATYENGTLKLKTPLPLKEHERVQVTVQSVPTIARQTAGMIPWTGDLATLDRLINDPEFGILESP
jgi:predicted DNA-binding antitoxin AbrB/MazE fold protein